MSAESQIVAALIAHAPLVAVVPATRISVDAVGQALAKPYIAFSKQGYSDDYGLNNSTLASTATIDILCVGTDRPNAIAVSDLVQAALVSAGQPSDRGSAGYDPENDLEVEIVTVDWITV